MTSLSFKRWPSLFLVTVLLWKLFHLINVSTPDFFWWELAWYKLCHPLALSPFVSHALVDVLRKSHMIWQSTSFFMPFICGRNWICYFFLQFLHFGWCFQCNVFLCLRISCTLIVVFRGLIRFRFFFFWQECFIALYLLLYLSQWCNICLSKYSLY